MTISLELNPEKAAKEENPYVVLFLDNENEEGVHAEEMEEIDFFKIVLYLNQGGSIFIANKKRRKAEANTRVTVSARAIL